MSDDKDGNKEVDALKAQLAEALKGIDALKAKNDELLGETKAAKAARREAEEKAKAEAEELARKSGDVQALEKSWADKVAKVQADKDAEIGTMKSQLHDLTVNAAAIKLASDLSVPGSADVLLPHIARRLAMEVQDGKPVVRVLGSDGKPSASSLDDLAKEIRGNAAFAPLIVGSQATGGGAAGSKGGGAAKKTITRQDFEALGHAERHAFVKDGGSIT